MKLDANAAEASQMTNEELKELGMKSYGHLVILSPEYEKQITAMTDAQISRLASLLADSQRDILMKLNEETLKQCRKSHDNTNL